MLETVGSAQHVVYGGAGGPCRGSDIEEVFLSAPYASKKISNAVTFTSVSLAFSL